MTSNCICGEVSVTVNTKPPFIFNCNCDLCRKSGAAWGYYPPSSVTVTGNTTAFSRRDKENPTVDVHSCSTCAATTHFEANRSFKITDPSKQHVGVNMRLFDPTDLKGVKLHYPNGKEWNGEGTISFRRRSLKVSKKSPW